MTDDERPKKSAWRWPQLIAVLVIVVVLIGMLLPVLHTSADGPRRSSQCGKYQSQLLGALLAYATSEEVSYPWPINHVPETVTDARSARVVTAQMLGVLSHSQSLPLGLLSCPDSKLPKMSKFPGNRPPIPITWGIDTNSAFYALDWSAPSEVGSSRVVMADRDPTAHKNRVMAVFGDAHVSSLRIIEITPQRTDGTLITEGADAKPFAVSVIHKYTADAQAVPPELIPDDIYTNEGDSENGSQPLVPAKGHPQRAWVK
jgi:hypothetical protein